MYDDDNDDGKINNDKNFDNDYVCFDDDYDYDVRL